MNIGQGYTRKIVAISLAVMMVLPSSFAPIAVAYADELATENQISNQKVESSVVEESVVSQNVSVDVSNEQTVKDPSEDEFTPSDLPNDNGENSSANSSFNSGHDEMNICHKTSSQTNPWNAIQIDDDAWPAHQSHGDFLYDGPLAPNGHPAHPEGNIWCADNAPQLPQEEICGDGIDNDGDGMVDEDCPPQETGSITICKLIADNEGHVATNSNNLPAGSFSVTLADWNNHNDVVGTANFAANTFAPNASVILEQNDAQCITYSNLEINQDGYFYGEEGVVVPNGTVSQWASPKYNDQYNTEVNSLDDFLAYDVNNDNSDGQIVLTHNIPNRTLVLLNTYSPNAPPQVCFAPSDLGDDEYDLVHTNPNEPSLQTIFNNNGYASVNVINDQTNTQIWNGNSQTVTIKAEYVAKYASRNQVFGYYLNGDASTFVPIFKVGDHTDYPSVPSFAPGQDITLTIPTSSTIGFAIDSQDISTNDSYTLATEIAENQDVADHVVVFNLSSDDYLLAFEDLLDNVADYDYNDLVVKVSLNECGSVPQNTPPTITVIGANPLSVTQGQVFVDPGATATDAEDGDLTSEIVVTGTVDTNTLGSYIVTYTVTDSGGLSDTETRTVNVVPDTTPTTGSITICKMIVSDHGVIATGPTNLPEGTFGVTLNSISGGATTTIQTAQFSSATFNPNTNILSGNYDADVNDDGTVNVDDLVAVVNHWGPCPGDCPFDTNGDGQVNATDIAIVKALWSDPFNPNGIIGDVNGDHVVNVEDLLAVISAWGQTSGPADLNHDGIVDNTDLQIVIATWGLTPLGHDAECITYDNLPFGEYSYNQENVTGSAWQTPRYNDQYDQTVHSLKDFYAFDPNNINSNGGITLNQSLAHRTLVVLNTYEDLTPENHPPVLTLLGNNPMSVVIGHTFTDPGATALDQEDGDLTSQIHATGTVNTNVLGSYTITYTVTDSGGLSDTETRTVNVIPDGGSQNQPPVITLIGDNPMNINRGDPFTDPGATATDPEDGDLTSQIVVTCNVDINNNGPYTCTYTVTDSGGLSDTETRTVIVNGGGGGGHNGGSSSGSKKKTGEVLGANVNTCFYLRDFLKMGWNNDVVEVIKLQVFLRTLEGFTDLPVTGVYDQATFDAVSKFQTKYADDIIKPWGQTTLGFTYILTRKKVNEIVCQTLFPLNSAQEQEIQDYRDNLGDGMGGEGNILFGNTVGSNVNNSLKDIAIGEISATSTEDTQLAAVFRGENEKDKTESVMGSVLGNVSFRNLASAIFAVPSDRADFLQCIYYLLMILIAIYILGTILANAQNSNTHTKEQIAQRRLTFFIAGVVLAILGALWFRIFCLIVPLVVILIILGISLFINRGKTPKTIMIVEKKEDK